MIPALSKPKPMNFTNRLASLPNNCFWTKHNTECGYEFLVSSTSLHILTGRMAAHWGHSFPGSGQLLEEQILNMSHTELIPQATFPSKLPG